MKIQHPMCLETQSFAALVLRMQKAITVLQVVGGGIRLAERCQKYLKRLLEFAMSLRQCQTSIQASALDLSPMDDLSSDFIVRPHPGAVQIQPPRVVDSVGIPDSSSSIDHELGPFLMGDDLDSFFAHFSHESTINGL